MDRQFSKGVKMIKRIIIIFICALLTIVYLSPNVAIIVTLSTIAYAEYTRLLLILIMSWNIAKLVQYGYDNYRSRNTNKGTQDVDKQVHEYRKYSYSIEHDKITFTFKDIVDHDGRQLGRLKFIREKFFKDKR
jgi:hypothetical protein